MNSYEALLELLELIREFEHTRVVDDHSIDPQFGHSFGLIPVANRIDVHVAAFAVRHFDQISVERIWRRVDCLSIEPPSDLQVLLVVAAEEIPDWDVWVNRSNPLQSVGIERRDEYIVRELRRDIENSPGMQYRISDDSGEEFNTGPVKYVSGNSKIDVKPYLRKWIRNASLFERFLPLNTCRAFSTGVTPLVIIATKREFPIHA